MQQNEIVLALYPNSEGIAYAFFYEPGGLIDADIIRIKPFNNDRLLKTVEKTINYYSATVVVLENPSSSISRKGTRACELIAKIEELAKRKTIPVFRYSREQIRFVFEQFKAITKYEIAEALAELNPQIKNKLPGQRKPWMDEDSQIGLFDALSLAYTHYYLKE